MLLVVDVEPDERKPRPGADDGFGGTRAALPLLEELRAALARRTGRAARLNWFLRIDPQIEQAWGRSDHVVRAVPELPDTIAARGDASGIHPHLWRWSDAHDDWLSDLDDADWMLRCLDTARDGYRAIFGHVPDACRFGDRWLSDAALAALHARGVAYDLTVEPGRPAERPYGDPHARGLLPDTHAVPRVPHRVRSEGPWIVPVTTSAPRWQPTDAPPFVVRASVSANLGRSPLLIGPLLARELSRDVVEPLVIPLRSGDLASPRRRRHVERNAARLLSHPGLARCTFTTTAEAVRIWCARRARTANDGSR